MEGGWTVGREAVGQSYRKGLEGGGEGGPGEVASGREWEWRRPKRGGVLKQGSPVQLIAKFEGGVLWYRGEGRGVGRLGVMVGGGPGGGA